MEGRVRRALLALVLTLLVIPQTWPRTRTALAERRMARVHACVFDHQMLWTPRGSCRPRARSYPRTVRGSVGHAIYDSALTFGIPYNVLRAVAGCESSLNTRAVNGQHFGLFQFLPATFSRGASGLFRETGITARSYWSALDASYVAGYLFATGKAYRWACERWPGGQP